ncbi:MAG: hypothetical protein KDJ65_07890 [Anaerolineae bacterium]|nr:hypothetical protein [Anaerolineae bacterium]
MYHRIVLQASSFSSDWNDLLWPLIVMRSEEMYPLAVGITGPDPKAANSYEQPNLVTAQPFQAVEISDGQAVITLPPLAVTALTFRLES